MFPEYEPHKIPIIYKGTGNYIIALAEEYATLYAKYLDTEYIKNKAFNKTWKKKRLEENFNRNRNR